ncbi:MAG: hypothetical protein U1B83_02600 [Candidatus Cloacimonadaceae bacterium]|nr:hypothetical protein [Candidatus Cloacimonadaceae bacterium]
MKKHAFDRIMEPLAPLESLILQVAVHQGYGGVQRLIVIFEDDPPQFFYALAPLVRYIQKHRLAEPLIINQLFIETSLDSYPLEFIDICSSYRNVFVKKDLLTDLRFAKADVRLQMERELKSKWLLTRQAVLEFPDKLKRVQGIIDMSRGSIYPVLKGFFALTDTDVPQELTDAITPAALISGVDLELLTAKIANIHGVYAYIAMLENLMIRVQSWEL